MCCLVLLEAIGYEEGLFSLHSGKAPISSRIQPLTHSDCTSVNTLRFTCQCIWISPYAEPSPSTPFRDR